jgi:hypothetical protein
MEGASTMHAVHSVTTTNHPLILQFNFLTDARFPNPFGCFYFHSPFDQFAHLGIDQFMA